jgi:hypothetical protein
MRYRDSLDRGARKQDGRSRADGGGGRCRQALIAAPYGFFLPLLGRRERDTKLVRSSARRAFRLRLSKDANSCHAPQGAGRLPQLAAIPEGVSTRLIIPASGPFRPNEGLSVPGQKVRPPGLGWCPSVPHSPGEGLGQARLYGGT